jgi:hypothetical protein
MTTDQPHPRRSEAFILALVIATVHAALLGVLTIIVWKSPFVIFRLPERTPPPAPAAISTPAQPI